MTNASSGSMNAVWLYLGKEVRNEQEVQQFVEWCSQNRIGKVLVHLTWQGDHNDALREQVAALTSACAVARIEVHGMVGALVERTSDRSKLLFDDPSCYCVDIHGINSWDEPVAGTAYVLDPSNPRVVKAISEGSQRLLDTFPGLAGIHLDFVRYYYFDSVLTVDTKSAGHWLGCIPKPGEPIRMETGNGVRTTFFVEQATNVFNDPPIGDKLVLRHEYRFCFCDTCVSGFSAHSGIQLPAELEIGTGSEGDEDRVSRDGSSISGQVSDNRVNERAVWMMQQHPQEWADYRAGLITALIRSIGRAVKTAHPAAQLSATIWYNAPYGNELRHEPLSPGSEYDCFGQKWQDWASQGLVDFLCPMDYWLGPDSFTQVVEAQVRGAGSVPIYPGLLNSSEYGMTSEDWLQYEQQALSLGASGMCFFHYGSWKSVI